MNLAAMLGKGKKRKGPRETLADDDEYNNSYNKWMDEHEKILNDDNADSETYANTLKERRNKINANQNKATNTDLGEGDAAWSALDMMDKKKRSKKMQTTTP